MKAACLLLVVCLASAVSAMAADESQVSSTPKGVPATRDEMKRALDALKERQPRLPLPPPTPDEEEQARRNSPARGLGGGLVNNARMRNRYLTEELRGGGFSREPDPVMTLKSPFVTELFWITSRVNNCHYCLGHQESKLSADGLTDDQIAALDGDWGDQTADRRAAFEYTRKATYEPNRISAADIEAVRAHFTELQTLEIVFLVARYNATNRWTDGLGIPQEPHRVYLTPTAALFQDRRSRVAPLAATPLASQSVGLPAAEAPRPPLEERKQVEAALAECAQRRPRFPLVGDAETRALCPELPAGPIPGYCRLLANFPKTGVGAVRSQLNLEQHGAVAPLLRARIAWVAARHDRAWYAVGHALEWLHSLGQTVDDAFALDQMTVPLSE